MKCRDENGFVLIAALWFVALLAFMGVIIAGWMTRSMEAAAALEDRITVRQDTIDATNQVAFLMISAYFSQRGIEILSGDALTQATSNPLLGVPMTGANYIALDNRPYRFGHSTVRLQDGSGLFPLNSADPTTLAELLKAYGVPYDARAGLADTLLDYIDKSEGQRLNGAKVDAYTSAGRPPPRNAPLLTPWEALRVLGWDQAEPLWSAPIPLSDVVSVGQPSAINPNTALAPVLGTLTGMNDRLINQLITYRATHLISSPADFEAAIGIASPDAFKLFYFPASHLRLKLTSSKDPLTHVIAVRRTFLTDAPYRIDYEVDLPKRPKTGQPAAADATLSVLPGSISP